MSRQNVVTGKIWVISGIHGELISNIDTDQIYHNAYLGETDIEKMGNHTFGNLEGWEDFPRRAEPGDIVITGPNFGAGSSRQHAVDCFKSMGIAAIIGESFGAIYKRNAINSGFPILSCPGIGRIEMKSGDAVSVDFVNGEIKKSESEKVLIRAQPMNDIQMDIYQAGNLFAYGRKMEDGV